MNRTIILVDIDHTLSAAWHRDGMIGNTTWDEYHSASPQDQPIHDMISLTNSLDSAGWSVIGITARPEKWRSLTNSWLVKHGIRLEELLMRPDESYHPAPEIKVQLALERFGSQEQLLEQVAFIIDDREDVCEAFHQLGVTTLQVKGRQND